MVWMEAPGIIHTITSIDVVNHALSMAKFVHSIRKK